VRLAPNDAKKLFQDRADYEKALKEKKKYDQKKKKNDPPFPMPPEPPQPDRYEKDTIKNMDAGAGLWREGEIPPGEWLVVYWYDHIGLANKAHIVDAILMFDDPKKEIERLRTPAAPAAVRPAADGKSFTLEFTVDEQLDSKKPQAPPGEEHSNEWALCDVMEGWLGRRPAKASWRFTITVPVKEGALKAHGW
jgi:hypothetical protein